MGWYPQQKGELDALLDKLLKCNNRFSGEIHGIIVPHAGYAYSGAVAGKAFSYFKNLKNERVIILSPSHYVGLRGLAKHNENYLRTPLGKIKLFEGKANAEEIDLSNEHAIGNQIPFLQKLGFQEIFPLVVGSITLQEAKRIAEILSREKGVFVVSADLSHFLEYKKALEKDRKTIEVIENLDLDNAGQIDSCGFFPILVAMNLCKINGWKPKLVKYENSGDVTGDKKSVVGYASFCF